MVCAEIGSFNTVPVTFVCLDIIQLPVLSAYLFLELEFPHMYRLPTYITANKRQSKTACQEYRSNRIGAIVKNYQGRQLLYNPHLPEFGPHGEKLIETLKKRGVLQHFVISLIRFSNIRKFRYFDIIKIDFVII